MEAARMHFIEALAELGADAWAARLLCLSGLTQQALLCADLDAAQAFNREALCLARSQGSLLFEGLLELDHAQWLEQRGAPQRAESLLADIHELLDRQADRPTPLLGRIALRRGRLALCQGRTAWLPSSSSPVCKTACTVRTNARCMVFSGWHRWQPISAITPRPLTGCAMPNA